jgi:hypothetical protein
MLGRLHGAPTRPAGSSEERCDGATLRPDAWAPRPAPADLADGAGDGGRRPPAPTKQTCPRSGGVEAAAWSACGATDARRPGRRTVHSAHRCERPSRLGVTAGLFGVFGSRPIGLDGEALWAAWLAALTTLSLGALDARLQNLGPFLLARCHVLSLMPALSVEP